MNRLNLKQLIKSSINYQIYIFQDQRFLICRTYEILLIIKKKVHLLLKEIQYQYIRNIFGGSILEAKINIDIEKYQLSFLYMKRNGDKRDDFTSVILLTHLCLISKTNLNSL